MHDSCKWPFFNTAGDARPGCLRPHPVPGEQIAPDRARLHEGRVGFQDNLGGFEGESIGLYDGRPDLHPIISSPVAHDLGQDGSGLFLSAIQANVQAAPRLISKKDGEPFKPQH